MSREAKIGLALFGISILAYLSICCAYFFMILAFSGGRLGEDLYINNVVGCAVADKTTSCAICVNEKGVWDDSNNRCVGSEKYKACMPLSSTSAVQKCQDCIDDGNEWSMGTGCIEEDVSPKFN